MSYVRAAMRANSVKLVVGLMKKFVHPILAVSLSFICFASNCKKPPKPHPNIDKGPYYLGDVKDYLYFKPGSFWVYKNNVTGELDTITMISIDTSLAYADEDLPDAHYFTKYTNLTFVQHSSRIKRNLTHSLYPPAAHNFGYSIMRNYTDGSFAVSYNYFKFPFLSNVDTAQVYSSTADFFDYRFNLTSGPFTFDTTVHLRVYDDNILPKSSILKTSIVHADHFWVKKVGLVKVYVKSYYPETKESWDLLDYKIIP